jgi:putative transposase
VRAAMVNVAATYRWSSHAGNSGARKDPLLKPHAEYLALGSDEQTRCVAYQGLFQQTLEPSVLNSIRQATQGGYPLATERFKVDVLKPAGCRIERGKPGPRVEESSAVYACEPG